MSINMIKYVGKVFRKVDDIKASGRIRVRIVDVSEGQFDKPDLTFHDGTQLSLNTTNARALARAYGMDSDDWLDKEVELEVGEIQFRGVPQQAILVKPISAPSKSELGDTIPF